MRQLVYALLLALLAFAPVERLDVAKLEPVQTVAVSREGDRVILRTDTEDQGAGQTAEAALADLKKNTPGVIYLDTAAYLLVTENAKEDAQALRPYLSKKVQISMWDGEGSIREAAKYLSVHGEGSKIARWRTELGS